MHLNTTALTRPQRGKCSKATYKKVHSGVLFRNGHMGHNLWLHFGVEIHLQPMNSPQGFDPPHLSRTRSSSQTGSSSDQYTEAQSLSPNDREAKTREQPHEACTAASAPVISSSLQRWPCPFPEASVHEKKSRMSSRPGYPSRGREPPQLQHVGWTAKHSRTVPLCSLARSHQYR